MVTALGALLWPEELLGDALEKLAQRARLASGRCPALTPPPPEERQDPRRLGVWLARAAGVLGVETVETTLYSGDFAALLPTCGPALLGLGAGHRGVLAVLRGRGRQLEVVSPDGSLHRVDLKQVTASLRSPVEAEAGVRVDELLTAAALPERRRARARSAMLAHGRQTTPVAVCWSLRMPPGADFPRQVRRARLLRPLVTFILAWAAQSVLWITSWWLVGRGALGGRLDPAWLGAWALLLLTLVPVRLLAGWSQASFAIGLGGLLKLRLLQGAVKLDPREIRHLGSGQLLGRVIECDTVEAMALNGGFLAVVAAVELLLAGLVLGAGAAGVLQVALLGAWLAGTLGFAWRAYRRWRQATDARLDLTHDLVESMVGHRTRVAQLPPEAWHEGEDRTLKRYLDHSLSFDRAARDLAVTVPRGWLAVGLAGLVPAFTSGTPSPVAVAVSLGGVLLAEGALSRLAASLWNLSSAAIAWRNTSQLFHAAARVEPTGRPDLADREPAEGPLLAAERLAFRYPDRGGAVLRDCSLRLEAGDRVLVVGASGAGKSTLASLLAGLRVPESGLLLLRGLDRHTVGSELWRRRVAVAPQFHDNHVFSATLAFNLLMGRRWPPGPEDLREAEAVCRELGLAELLATMPGGLWQVVGETGWQLSHGERSRLFVARALLQGADVVVLDESFASLDAETLRHSLECALRRARTLVVIAHP